MDTLTYYDISLDIAGSRNKVLEIQLCKFMYMRK